MFKAWVLKAGVYRTVALVTAVSIILSVLLTTCIGLGTHVFLGQPSPRWPLLLWTSSLVPLLIAPVVSWSFVSLVIKVSKLEDETRRLSTMDSLTGLLNRGALMSRLTQMHHLVTRESSSLVLLLLDIDHFKSINDRFGHAAGDVVLRDFSMLMQQQTRAADIVGRMGGEEFLIGMYGATLQEAHSYAERLHQDLAQQSFIYDGQVIQVTVSVGMAEMHGDRPVGLEVLIQQADQAMYLAKRSGRNQTKVFSQT